MSNELALEFPLIPKKEFIQFFRMSASKRLAHQSDSAQTRTDLLF